MEDQKRQMIIDEIHHWRKNKLLPESYCIFLLNLYSEGEHTSNKSSKVRSSFQLTKSQWLKWILNILMIVTILLVGINFNSFPFALQIVVFGTFLLLSYFSGYYFKTKSPLISNLILGLASIGLLIFGNVLFKFESSSSAFLYFAIVCLIWVLTGVLSKATFLLYCGLIGSLLIYGWYVHPRIIEHFSMMYAQLYWLPESMIVLWLFSLFYEKYQRIAIAFVVVSGLMWFAPEIHYIVNDGIDSFLLQALFVIKVIIAGLLSLCVVPRIKTRKLDLL